MPADTNVEVPTTEFPTHILYVVIYCDCTDECNLIHGYIFGAYLRIECAISQKTGLLTTYSDLKVRIAAVKMMDIIL